MPLFVAFPGNPGDPKDTAVAALRHSLERVIATGRPDRLPVQRFPIRVMTPEGHEQYEERFWNAVNTPVFGREGRLLSISHTTVDVTTQTRAETALRQSEERYRNLFDSLIDGFCIIEMLYDPNGAPVDLRFCEINRLFEQQTGLRDVVGKTARQLRPQLEQYWFEIYGTVARTGLPVRFEKEAKPLNRWFDVYAFRADETQPHKIAILFRDITDHKRAEEKLRGSEANALEAARQAEAERQRLDAVLEAAPVGIVVADARGKLLQTNPANRRLWGEQHPLSESTDEYKEWKGWWADGSNRNGRPLEAQEWGLARVLRGEDAAQDIIEIETFDSPPVRRIILNSAAPIRDGAGNITGGVVALLDITDRVRAETSLRETAARLQFTLDSAQLGDWDLDLVSGTVHRSLRHDQCFGYSRRVAAWDVDTFMRHLHPDDRAWVKSSFDHAVSGREDWHFECRVIWPDGSLHWIAVHGTFYSGPGKARRMAGVIQDITDRKQAEEEIRHASLHDALTGLPNRAMLTEYASHLIAHNRRTRRHAAVLFLDLDRFKPINDTHGHNVGDVVLKEVAGRLSSSLRAEDVVTRLGGDEFVVFLQDIKSPAQAAEVARHIVERINEPYCLGDLSLSLSTSIGISMCPDDGLDVDTLISHADMAMYQAKQAGRNTFQFYLPEFAVGTRLQMAIEEQLKAALGNHGFHLCYQPVLDVQTGEIVSVEALLRWRHTDIGPDRFVPVAEATGIINPIGSWLIEEASRQYKKWLDRGLPPIPIAVNVSVVEFRDKNFVDRFESTIHKHGIDTGALQLELTETAVMDEIDHAVAALSRLKQLGVKVLLDDFGTGHSSLAYLARLPLNKIKIDKSFILRLESDVASRAVTDAMIALGRTLNLEVVAEGIETPGMLDYVSSHGCEQAQGFYLGRPMGPDAFEAWYRQNGGRVKRTAGASSGC